VTAYIASVLVGVCIKKILDKHILIFIISHVLRDIFDTDRSH